MLPRVMVDTMSYELYWGDLHSHCGLSGGLGMVDQALQRARQQLDFASVTGQAFWPDMPSDLTPFAKHVDRHRADFDWVAKNWSRLLQVHEEATSVGQFVAFPSYEWQSLGDGDHNVYSPTSQLPLRNAMSASELHANAASIDGIAIPHSLGHADGFRGVDWDSFSEAVSPFVEVFSAQGCSISDQAAYPLLGAMGPRDSGGTAEAGWQKGLRFGVSGGTNHQAGYPGSHGDGRMGVFAESLTRESIWEAMRARRIFAATGDRIDARMWIDGAWIGSEVENSGRRSIRIQVRGCDALDKVHLLKNGRVMSRFFPPSAIPNASRQRYRLRIGWGWGKPERSVNWLSEVRLSTGRICKLETCFSSESISSTLEATADSVSDGVVLPHEILEQDERAVAWRSRTRGNPTNRHASMQALSLEIEGPLDAALDVTFNGRKSRHTLASLLRAGRCQHQPGWFGEAARIGPLIPLEECELSANVVDVPEDDVDVYRLEVCQINGQWAWLSPIWVRR